MDILKIEDEFTNSIEDLKKDVCTKGSDYFFTEKEIHSYFYHLCQNKKIFDYQNTFLIHTEYPTPFKCLLTGNESPYIRRAEDTERAQRAHLDLVLLNPNFIHWITENKYDDSYIYGLGGYLGSKFSDYIIDFRTKYQDFMSKYKESILLNVIEFKYLRHSYDGVIYTKINILQDIEKLTLLNNYRINNCTIPYAKKVNSLVFVGKRYLINPRRQNELNNIHNEICSIHYMNS